MYIETTTAAERELISDKTSHLFSKVEAAHDFLEGARDDLNAAMINKNASLRYTAKEVESRMSIVTDILFDVCLQYALMTGEDFCGVEPHMKSIERVTLLKNVEALRKELYQRMEEVEGQRRAEYRNLIREAMNLSDAEALSKFTAIKTAYLS